MRYTLPCLALALLLVAQLMLLGITQNVPELVRHAAAQTFDPALFYFTPTAPEIDGEIQDSEWAGAPTLDIILSGSGSDIPGSLHVMNDENNLYIALTVQDNSTLESNILQLRFDNNHDGLLGPGEDVFHYDPLSPTIFDSFVIAVENFPGSVEYDINDGGTSDGEVAMLEGPDSNNYEFSHPLCSSDIAHDFCLSLGSSVGVSILYSIPGVGSAIWPLGVQAGGDPSSFAEIVVSSGQQPPADIVIRDFRTDKGLGATYTQGSFVTLLLELENIGAGEIPEGCMVVNMVANSPNGDPVLEYDNDYASTIGPGDIVTIPYEFQIPDGAPIGWYNIRASASLGGMVCGGSDQEQISYPDAFKVDPNCMLPEEAVLVAKDQLPEHHHHTTFSSSELGPKTFPDPILPIASIFAGTNNSAASGFILRFSSDGLDYSCPISPSMISIEFGGGGRNITGVSIQNVGTGSNSSASIAAAIVSYENYKFTELPGTAIIMVNQPPPDTVHEINFSTVGQRTVIAPLPVVETVMGIWIAADANLQEPHLYFRTSNGWYAASVGLSSGKLFTFGVETEISEIAVTVDDVSSDGKVRLGYVYPVPVELEADAGTDQTVKEVQDVYLDGSGSEGPEGVNLMYKWTQIAGPSVILTDANTESAHFVSPRSPIGALEVELRFQLAISDSKGNVDMDSIVITVKSTGLPPFVYAGNDVAVYGGTEVMLNGTIWDPDSKASDITIRWTQVNGISVLLKDSDTAHPSFLAPDLADSQEADLKFALFAEDINDNSNTAYVTINVIGKKQVLNYTAPPEDTAISAPTSDVAAINPVMEVAGGDPIPLVTILAVIPAGVVLAIVATVKHRSSSRMAKQLAVEPAKILFPNSDPVADEYQATRPFIEALEKELGTKLETATSISDLLEKYSGRKKVDSG